MATKNPAAVRRNRKKTISTVPWLSPTQICIHNTGGNASLVVYNAVDDVVYGSLEAGPSGTGKTQCGNEFCQVYAALTEVGGSLVTESRTFGQFFARFIFDNSFPAEILVELNTLTC